MEIMVKFVYLLTMDEALKQTILSSLNVLGWLSKFLFEAHEACKTFDELGYQTFGLFFIKQLNPDCPGGRLKGLISANYFISFDYQVFFSFIGSISQFG